MKKNKPSRFFLFIVLFLLISVRCQKELPSNGADAATVSISVATKITSVSAVASALVISDQGARITSRGFCWGTDHLPDLKGSKSSDSIGIGDYKRKITGLTPATTYYLRAYAGNSAGITYGEEIAFQTSAPPQFNTLLSYGTMTDIDGNTYKTIQIGSQTWMAENLKTTRFRNGDPIPLVTGNDQWKTLTTAAYCNYDNEEDYSLIYGRLYNGFAVNDSRNLAPQGWHIPGDAEWTTLENSLGGYSSAANKLKETGTSHWNNGIGTNESGFTALPGGFRDGTIYGGPFYNLAIVTYLWSNTLSGTTNMYYRSLMFNRPFADRHYGMSVRCVKD